jgi:hypothetical protein
MQVIGIFLDDLYMEMEAKLDQVKRAVARENAMCGKERLALGRLRGPI